METRGFSAIRPNQDDAVQCLKMLINGEEYESQGGRRLETVDPYAGKVWATVPDAGEPEVQAAVQAARAALEGPWGSMSGSERGHLMRRFAGVLAENAERLARIESTDNGKLLREMSGQLNSLPEWYYYFGGAADKLHGYTIPSAKSNFFTYTTREPVGVVAGIIPWNSPLLLLTWKLAPALAAGCTFVAKPAEQTPASTLELGRLFEEAGFPPGVFNVVTGGAETGHALVANKGVDKIAFTGSTASGTQVMKTAADHLARVSLELGGKSPNIVFDDADLEAATNGIVAGVFAATGQTCIAGSRLCVSQGVHDQLVARIVDRAKEIKLGDPLLSETEMGPVAFKEQLDKIQSYIDIGVNEGAEIACGGRPPSDTRLQQGYFFEPTVFRGVQNNMRIAQEEIFGPVLSVIPFTDEREAIQIANDSQYGLGAGIWTTDVRRAHRVAGLIKAGTIWVNSYRAISYNVPFGGYRHSGIGRENGWEALYEYLETKSVWIEMTGETRDPFVLG